MPGEELNSQRQRDKILGMVLPQGSLKIDENTFKNMLADSVVLSFDDKLKFIAGLSKMTQEQFDNFMALLKEEQQRYIDLDSKQVDKMKDLRKKFKEKQSKLSSEIDKQLTTEEEKQIIGQLQKDIDKKAS